MFKRILSTCALAVLFCRCAGQANAAFYLRPEVQFGSLADGHSDTDIGVGGALAWGGAFGQDQRFEVGVEISSIKYKGKFDSFSYVGLGTAGGVEWKKVSTKCSVTPVQAAFRYNFLTNNTKVRPYLGLSLGYSWVYFDTPSYAFLGNQGACWTGSLGGGVSYRLGRRTSANVGYRYHFSEDISVGPHKIRPNAHVFSLAITQLLGRLRK